MFKYGYETNIKWYSKKILIIFKGDDILLEMKLIDKIIQYRIVLFHTRSIVDKEFIYCKYEEAKEKENFKKLFVQLKEDMKKLIKMYLVLS